ncbi:MAG: hypothetical protein JNM56_29290 [Planctomycetia bacterium]|nr:hypothetical protein [Planctomycetia bacterium]
MMSMDNNFLTDLCPRPGFRLHKLEVYNWGTFDSAGGGVHAVRPAGQTTLLIGQNGSGKSTLVDALLTLLVRPVVRNYNVAAGAGKQERNERSYIKGAYGRLGRDEEVGAEVQYLRPGNAHYSVLLGCFRNESSGQAFTIAVLLYLNSEGGAEKVYCFAPAERSVAADCAGLASTEKLRQQMEKRGFRATTSYTEYQSWLVKTTGLRAKAMDVFNQTVAVKDIRSLTGFVREHMLEAKAWGEKVDSLLNHFTQLSEAHRCLVRVRRQFELLEPVASFGEAYQEQARLLEQAVRLMDAADSFFRQKTVDLLAPECETRRGELAIVRQKKDQLGRDITVAQEECRRLKNELEHAGGERLRQIPLLIQNHEAQAATKRDASRRYHEALRGAGLGDDVTSEVAFAGVQARLVPLSQELAKHVAEAEKRRDELVVERGTLKRNLEESQAELEALAKRGGNLPEAFAHLRRQLCEHLHIAEKDLPFAAELIAVKPEERPWEASIEMVLRGFGLSLLVPQKYYPVVSGYVDRTRLADGAGRGQRLVYVRVGERTAPPPSQVPDGQSLVRKLTFRDGQPLVPWLKGELAERFDYRCCEDLTEFQEAPAPALTRQRHVKVRGGRHEKDDRDRVADPRNYVLGWDNREKRRRLAEAVQQLRDEHGRLDLRITKLEQELVGLRGRQVATAKAQEITDFTLIDHAHHEREVAALRLEKQSLEEQSDTIRLLKQRLGEAESRQTALQQQRDDTIRTETTLGRELDEGQRLVANAQAALQRRQAEGIFARHAVSFAELEACFVAPPLTAECLFEQEKAFLDNRRADLDRLRRALDPLKTQLCNAMLRFLHEFREERTDLEPQVDYLASFLRLREHIRREDLPRHVQRFKERLNEKVLQEIGLLNGAFQTERNEISAKIGLLNRSLQKLEYRPGTHMRLELRPVRDVEIAEFQDALKACLAGTFEGTLEADEARFLEVEKLINRLRDEQRWRDKVTDVRRWFEFAAREIDTATGEQRSYFEDSTGQSGGEKAKLAFTILVAAIAYQYDIEPESATSNKFHFVVVDEMFSKVDDQYATYALELFRKFGLQLLIVAPLDAKALVTEPYVGCYLHVVKDATSNRSEVFSMTARDFEEIIAEEAGAAGPLPSRARKLPR